MNNEIYVYAKIIFHLNFVNKFLYLLLKVFANMQMDAGSPISMKRNAKHISQNIFKLPSCASNHLDCIITSYTTNSPTRLPSLTLNINSISLKSL